MRPTEGLWGTREAPEIIGHISCVHFSGGKHPHGFHQILKELCDLAGCWLARNTSKIACHTAKLSFFLTSVGTEHKLDRLSGVSEGENRDVNEVWGGGLV